MDNVDKLPIELRTITVKRDGEWITVRMGELKIGEIFKVFNPDGEKVVWDDNDEFISGSKPYIGSNGRWEILMYSAFDLEGRVSNDGEK